MKFEVHFQMSMPDHHPVSVTGSSLSETYTIASLLWKKFNKTTRSGHANVFICVNNCLFVLDAQDAAEITMREGGEGFTPEMFNPDCRLIEKVGMTVWSKTPDDSNLPGWHSKKLLTIEDARQEFAKADPKNIP